MELYEKSSFLKLVIDEPKERAYQEMIWWLNNKAPDPIPDEPIIILGLDGCPGGLARQTLRELLEHLVATDQYKRIKVGSRQYLKRQTKLAINCGNGDALFKLEIAIDLESEKQLLYKTVIVLELIVIALILRQVVLDPQTSLDLFWIFRSL